MAEVLITLGIIGVVVAMTMPTLIAKYQEKVIVTQFKKSYSQMQNALKLYAADNDCVGIACISDTTQTSDDLMRKIAKYYNGAKYCEVGNKSKECANYGIKSSSPFNDGYGKYGSSDSIAKPFIIAADGSLLRAVQYSDCPREVEGKRRDEDGNFILGEDGGVETFTYTNYYCALLYIDANGPLKGPNQFGADIYRFDIDQRYNDKLLSIHQDLLNSVLLNDKLKYTPYTIGADYKK